MVETREPLTPAQVDTFARVVDQMRSSYSGLPLKLESADADGRRDFSYRAAPHDLNVTGTAATFGPDVRITRLEITSADEDHELTAGLMKHVKLGAITASLESLLTIESAEKSLAEARRNPSKVSEMTWLVIRMASEQAAPTTEPAAPRRHGGREPLTSDHFRNVALAYLEETAPGKPKKPLERMAERFGRPEETVRTWIARARKEGWLGPAVKGRAGAEPGPRLLAGADFVMHQGGKTVLIEVKDGRGRAR